MRDLVLRKRHECQGAKLPHRRHNGNVPSNIASTHPSGESSIECRKVRNVQLCVVYALRRIHANNYCILWASDFAIVSLSLAERGVNCADSWSYVIASRSFECSKNHHAES